MNQPDPDPTQALAAADLAALVAHHNYLYFIEGAPEIPDAEFDGLVRQLQELAPDHPVLQEVGAPQLAPGDKVDHRVPMLSLEKCYDDTEFRRWAKAAPGALLVATPKIDGLACSLLYGDDGVLRLGATRGDGVRGENVTASVRQVRDVPARLQATGHPGIEVEVRGEVYLPLTEFAKVSAQFANPRNLAAGTLKAKDRPAIPVDRLRFLAYDLIGLPLATERAKFERLTALGFEPAPLQACDEAGAEAAFQALADARPSLDYELDGVVFRFDDVALQQRLGVTSHHPRGAVAWKFPADASTSTLQEVEWSVSRTGTITPVAIVAPVQLSGASVTRATLHNVSNLRRLGLHAGDTVELVRRGGVIPHLEATRGGGKVPIEVPERCPSCASPTQVVATTRKTPGGGTAVTQILMCTTPEQCTNARSRQLLHFCDALELEGFGSKVVDVLLERGLVTDAADLFTLQAGDLEGLPRFGPTMAANLVRQVDKARTVDLAAFLRALGIDSLGKHAAALLANRWDLDTIRSLAPQQVADLHSLGDITGESIVEGLRTHASLIDKLLQHVAIERKQAPASGTGPLSGHIVVFTGKLERMGRRDAQHNVVKLGGLAGDAVTVETTLLVVAADEFDAELPSSKLKKARKLEAAEGRIRILREPDYWAWLEAGAVATVQPPNGEPRTGGDGA